MASISGTLPAKSHSPLNTSAGAHGVGKNWFTSAKKLRDANANVSAVVGGTANALEQLRLDGKIRANTYIPFSDNASLNYEIN